MSDLLLQKAKRGDSDAFCELMNRYIQDMYKISWAYLKNDEDAADAIQDTILTCFEKLQTLKQNKYFKTWMVRILINKCKDILQKNSRVVYTDVLEETPVYEDEYESAEWKQVLDLLDEKYRTILLLYYMEGFNTREISEILDMKENTVKSRLKRGRQKIVQTYDGGERRTQDGICAQ